MEDEKPKGMTPGMIVALAQGRDISDGTPGGIEASERMGQIWFIEAKAMPAQLHPNREAYEALGFTFGEPIDKLFVAAALPNGWSKRRTDHDMHSEIVDAEGRKRVEVFYKAAFYDRRADARLVE